MFLVVLNVGLFFFKIVKIIERKIEKNLMMKYGECKGRKLF